jgi:hypothetical protein
MIQTDCSHIQAIKKIRATILIEGPDSCVLMQSIRSCSAPLCTMAGHSLLFIADGIQRHVPAELDAAFKHLSMDPLADFAVRERIKLGENIQKERWNNAQCAANHDKHACSTW